MNIFLKKIILIIILVSISVLGYAQDDILGSELKKNIFVGGSLQFQFGDFTAIGIDPFVGYHINNYLSGGFGGAYQYYYQRSTKMQQHIYGGRSFLRIQPLRMIFLHFEYEILSYKTNVNNPPTYSYENVISQNVLVGGGYRGYISENLSSTIMMLYNLNQTELTPYSNPVFRISFEWNFPANNK